MTNTERDALLLLLNWAISRLSEDESCEGSATLADGLDDMFSSLINRIEREAAAREVDCGR